MRTILVIIIAAAALLHHQGVNLGALAAPVLEAAQAGLDALLAGM
jgi:hypothetical protein